jgi:AbrB family looped-hinge helix DNA binding protein
MAQPAVADFHRVLSEFVHHCPHNAGTGKDDIGALRLQADDRATFRSAVRTVQLDLAVDLGAVSPRADRSRCPLRLRSSGRSITLLIEVILGENDMATTITSKGQVTIPKHIRDALQLAPGNAVDFSVNRAGEVVLQRAKRGPARKRTGDRFAAVRGRAEVKWRTRDLMKLLRNVQ